MTLKTHLDETLHYMRVLQENYVFMQPEMRHAIDHSIFILTEIQKRHKK